MQVQALQEFAAVRTATDDLPSPRSLWESDIHQDPLEPSEPTVWHHGLESHLTRETEGIYSSLELSSVELHALHKDGGVGRRSQRELSFLVVTPGGTMGSGDRGAQQAGSRDSDSEFLGPSRGMRSLQYGPPDSVSEVITPCKQPPSPVSSTQRVSSISAAKLVSSPLGYPRRRDFRLVETAEGAVEDDDFMLPMPPSQQLGFMKASKSAPSLSMLEACNYGGAVQ